MTSGILSLLWKSFSENLLTSRVSMSQSFELIQAKLKILPWNKFVPSENDFRTMFEVNVLN